MRTASRFGLRGLLNCWLPLALLGAGLGLTDSPLFAESIENSIVRLTAAKAEGGITGFELTAEGRTVAAVRFSSAKIGMVAGQLLVNPSADTLIFKRFEAKSDSGLRFGKDDSVTVHLKAADPFPVVSFGLTVASFDPRAVEKRCRA